MNTNQAVIDYAEQAIIHTYNRFPVALDHGDGVYLYDVEGKKYLDFAAGIAVCAFGYNVPEFNQALKDQIDKMIHVSNLYYTEPMAKAANRVTAATGLKKLFFTNSGTEAIEGAIKLARKYAYIIILFIFFYYSHKHFKIPLTSILFTNTYTPNSKDINNILI